MESQTYTERLVRLEERVDNIKTDQAEMKGDVKEIKGVLQNLPDSLVAKLDERYALKKVVDDMQETIDPLTKLRKRIWSVYVVAAISFAAITTIFIEYIKSKLAG